MSRKNRVTVQCASCGSDIERAPSVVALATRQFCNRRCYADWQSANVRGENSPSWKPKVRAECEVCGKEVLRDPSHMVHKHIYCSKACTDRGKGGRTEVQCHWCGKTFERQANHAKREQRHFCNSTCKGAWLKTQTGPNATAYKGTMVQVECSQCGKAIQRDPAKVKRNDRFFCGGGCWNKWRSIHLRDENNPNFSVPAIETHCALCEKPIRRKPWRFGETKRTRHFCCAKHRAEWCKINLVGENSGTWKGGAVRYYGPNWRAQMRAARKRDGYTCQVCGMSQKKNGRSLDVHHITPFRAFNYIPGENENYLQANDLINLISLCRNCHMKAESGHVALQPKLL